MTIQSIAPGSNDRMRILITKSAETFLALSDLVHCPVKKARFKAKAAAVQQRAKEL